ncbi:MAG: glycosyltransferase family 2 protein [Pseudomonadota bacterium]
MSDPTPSINPNDAASFAFDVANASSGVKAGLSVVTPMFQEAEGAVAHVEEIQMALANVPSMASEVIVVDDGSTDDTAVRLLAARAGGLNVRVISHHANAGQSRAVRSGVLAARYAIIATLDGDRQNDPNDLISLYKSLISQEATSTGKTLAMVAGERQARQDGGPKRLASSIANGVRQRLLADGARDSGCGLKVFHRAAYLRLPYFDHMHRYMPFLMKREGFAVRFMPVGHRARAHGQSKYTNLGRLAVAFRDLIGVLWLKSRARDPEQITER